MSAPASEIETRILSFVEEHFLVEHEKDFDTATNLFEVQIIDSFGFVELVRFLESEFQVTIQDNDLLTGGLTSIKSMVNLVEKRAHESIHA